MSLALVTSSHQKWTLLLGAQRPRLLRKPLTRSRLMLYQQARTPAVPATGFLFSAEQLLKGC